MPSPSDARALRYRVHYAYHAKAIGDAAERGRTVRDWLKRGRRPDAVVARMSEVCAARGVDLTAYLGQHVTLVPVPGHALCRDDALWPALELCHALVAVGYGHSVAPLLERCRTVPKSTLISSAANRPSPTAHMESLRVIGSPIETGTLTLVDDVVTRGSTFLGCAMALRRAYPAVDVRAFAFLRHQRSVDDQHAPHEGEISVVGENEVQAR